jgi:GGDEF domain-containing protein
VARFNDRSGAPQHAEIIRAAVEGAAFVVDDGAPLRRTCSIGFAAFPFVRTAPHLLTWSQVLRFADDALYLAKETRNAWVGVRAGEGDSWDGDLSTLVAAGAVVVEEGGGGPARAGNVVSA